MMDAFDVLCVAIVTENRSQRDGCFDDPSRLPALKAGHSRVHACQPRRPREKFWAAVFGLSCTVRIAYNSGMDAAVPLRRFSQPAKQGFRWLPLLLLFTVIGAPALFAQTAPTRGRKYVPPPDTAKITVVVTKETNGKPVENAAVIFHPMKDNKDEGNLELKTNEDGKAVIDVIPIGDTVRLQVIANGFQTFGDDYQITTDSKEIQVKLKRPARQYSIYEKHSDTQEGGADSTPAPAASKPPQQ
jgi:hypothetical protein